MKIIFYILFSAFLYVVLEYAFANSRTLLRYASLLSRQSIKASLWAGSFKLGVSSNSCIPRSNCFIVNVGTQSLSYILMGRIVVIGIEEEDVDIR